ncbi:MAG TPA: DUF3307 domain-containing protein [Opitutaceae bacterium]|jgi:hypothetical protein
MTLFEQALMMHLIGDWLLQNDWMVRHKFDLRHPAAWIHGGIHGVLLGLIFGWLGGLVLGLSHVLIDTRIPGRWWGRLIGQTQTGEMSVHVDIWRDQVLHIGMIALWSIVRLHLGR